MNPEKLRANIHQLLAGQRLAVLSTSDKRRPYASLVAFCFSPDLRIIYFATPRATRKYANLMNQPQVAFLVDSRANQAEDFHQAAAVTVLGRCEEVAEERKEKQLALTSKNIHILRSLLKHRQLLFLSVHVENVYLCLPFSGSFRILR